MNEIQLTRMISPRKRSQMAQVLSSAPRLITIKSLFLQLCELEVGLGKINLSLKKKEQLINLATDALLSLPDSYLGLKTSTQILHTNQEENYQLLQEGCALVLYDFNYSLMTKSFIRNLRTRTLVINLNSHFEYENLLNQLDEIKSISYWDSKVGEIIDKLQVIEAKYKFRLATFTQIAVQNFLHQPHVVITRRESDKKQRDEPFATIKNYITQNRELLSDLRQAQLHSSRVLNAILLRIEEDKHEALAIIHRVLVSVDE